VSFNKGICIYNGFEQRQTFLVVFSKVALLTVSYGKFSKGGVTVVQLRSALGVEGGGGVFVSLALFFFSPPRFISPLEINGTCRECSKGATRGLL